MATIQFENYKIALATNLRLFRVRNELRAEDLAMALGMSVRHYYRFESIDENCVTPGSELLPVLASFYKCTIDELYGLSLPKSTLTDEESLLLGYFRSLSENLKRSLISLTGVICIHRTSAAKVDKIADILRMPN